MSKSTRSAVEAALPEPAVYTVSETCRQLRVSRGTVNRLIREGKLRSVRIGRSRRILASSVPELLERLQERAE
jgi:excisionase family DNA binding protein